MALRISVGVWKDQPRAGQLLATGCEELDERIGNRDAPLLLVLGSEPEVEFLAHSESLTREVHVSPRGVHRFLFPNPGAKQELEQVNLFLVGCSHQALNLLGTISGDRLFCVLDPVRFEQGPGDAIVVEEYLQIVEAVGNRSGDIAFCLEVVFVNENILPVDRFQYRLLAALSKKPKCKRE
jgi:hypothetical protein